MEIYKTLTLKNQGMKNENLRYKDDKMIKQWTCESKKDKERRKYSVILKGSGDDSKKIR